MQKPNSLMWLKEYLTCHATEQKFYVHETDPKIAFENELNDLFNEIWLTRMLCDLWYNELWDKSNVKPGMMFKFYHTNADGSPADLNKYFAGYDELKIRCAEFFTRVSEPHVVTSVEHYVGHIDTKIYFRPLWLGVGTWDDTWNITKMKENYYFSYIPRGMIRGI